MGIFCFVGKRRENLKWNKEEKKSFAVKKLTPAGMAKALTSNVHDDDTFFFAVAKMYANLIFML